ncbi:Os10g0490400 [Oryza sativa Japonica Group]|uniref:Os10g0490400 protein n=1 Tax=Oryza sativa subsp. japonica TaxID=39947 RepID=A0A0P0XVL6_ORYSJ|nr:Os10g0490400 [Oryza sativa Japonica Group]
MPNYDQISNKSGNCEKSNDPDCCEDGKAYPQYRCSPPVTAAAGAVLTLNSFEKGKDGGGPSECCRRGGSPAWRGAGTGSGSRRAAAAGGRWWRRWWTSATPCTAATASTTTSRRATTTSWTRRRRCGTPSASTRASGWSTSPGPTMAMSELL